MSRRKMGGLKRPLQIDVKVDVLEDEFIARESFSRSQSKTEFLRTGRLPQDRVTLERLVNALRKKQRGLSGILRNELNS